MRTRGRLALHGQEGAPRLKQAMRFFNGKERVRWLSVDSGREAADCSLPGSYLDSMSLQRDCMEICMNKNAYKKEEHGHL